MKKLLLICLTALLPLSMWAASFTYDNIIYNVLDDTTCEVGDNEYNSSLPSAVVIPEKVYDENDKEYTVVGIDDFAFFLITSITSITIPETVTYVGYNAFSYCSSLTTVYSLNPEPPMCYDEAFRTYNSPPMTLYVPKGSKDAYAVADEWGTRFAEIVEMESEEKGEVFEYEGISYCITSTTDYEVEVDSNTSVAGELVIPRTVYYNGASYAVVGIGESAFEGAELTSITIPKSVTYVNDSAFNDCTTLTTIYSVNPTPPTCGNNVFDNVPENCTLYVPRGSKDTYSSATGWNYFSNIEEENLGILVDGDVFEYEGISYRVTSATDNTVEVGANTSATGEIVIPNPVYYTYYDGEYNDVEYNVVGIGESAFDGAELTSVTIPESVTYVEDSAFRNCTELTTVYSLNPTPPTCGDNVFDNVPENCTLYVPQGSKETYASADVWSRFANNIAEDVFEYEGMCYHITSVADYTVETAYSSTLVTTYAGDIVIPETVKYENTTYTVVGIGAATFDIGTSEGAINITSVDIPKTVTYIGDGAFYRCTGLTGTLTIPSNVTSIGQLAYAYCSGLTGLVIEYGEEPLHFDLTSSSSNSRTFYRCPFERIYVDRNMDWEYEDATPWGDSGTLLHPISTITEFEIGEHMTAIPHYMCGGLSSLKEIIIPDNITDMGSNAYLDCVSATNLSISKNLTSLPMAAFANCSSLTEVEIPDNVTEIGLNAFVYCASVTSVTLPSNLTTIGNSAFYNCDLSELTIPEKVANIGSGAFEGNSNLRLVLSFNPEPPTCTSSDVFEGTDEQCVLYVPNESKELYSSADVWKDFYEIHGLSEPYVSTLDATYITRTTATLNGTVEFFTEDKDDITEQGFEYWLEENDVMKAEATVVDGEDISALVQDLVENKNYTYRAYAKIESDTYYGTDFVFSTSNRNGDFCVDGIYYNYGEEEGTCVVTYRDENYNYYSGVMDIPESVLYNNTNYTVVGVGTWAFYQSPELIEVTIPNTVTSVANQAFNACDALEKATIGSSVETIGSVSFNCPSLLELISLNPTPPTCNANAFEQVDKSVCVLTVPEGSEDAYATADVWKDFFPTDDDTTGIDSILVEEGNVEGIYSTSGQKLNTTVKGVNIIRYVDGTVKKVYVK